MVRKVKKIEGTVSAEKVKSNLDKYQKLALELGAAEAKIIDAGIIPVDERVYIKCLYPRCLFYGTNANCPPHSLSITPDFTRSIIAKYKHAVIFRVKVPTEVMVNPDLVNDRRAAQLKIFEIVSKVEGDAFRDGHYFALGFAGGPCKRLFCEDQECSALVPGQSCRAFYKARTPMEGAGIDVYGLVTKIGWDLYPVGFTTQSEDAPFGQWVGLVLI